jgi:hypothetical protein
MSERPNESSPHFVTCPCQVCSGKIEFDASDFGQGETRTVECPFCKMETVIFISELQVSKNAIRAKIEPPPPLPPLVIWFGSESSVLNIKTVSGVEIEIKSVRLFNARDLQMLANKKSVAAQKMGGVSTGLIPFGSLSSVLIASGAIAAVDAVLSSGSAQSGQKLFQEAMNQEKKLRTLGEFFPVGMIDEIENPAPQLWNVPMQAMYSSGYVHNGDDFIVVKDTSGKIHKIRWSSVELYDCQANK